MPAETVPHVRDHHGNAGVHFHEKSDLTINPLSLKRTDVLVQDLVQWSTLRISLPTRMPIGDKIGRLAAQVQLVLVLISQAVDF